MSESNGKRMMDVLNEETPSSPREFDEHAWIFVEEFNGQQYVTLKDHRDRIAAYSTIKKERDELKGECIRLSLNDSHLREKIESMKPNVSINIWEAYSRLNELLENKNVVDPWKGLCTAVEELKAKLESAIIERDELLKVKKQWDEIQFEPWAATIYGQKEIIKQLQAKLESARAVIAHYAEPTAWETDHVCDKYSGAVGDLFNGNLNLDDDFMTGGKLARQWLEENK